MEQVVAAVGIRRALDCKAPTERRFRQRDCRPFRSVSRRTSFASSRRSFLLSAVSCLSFASASLSLHWRAVFFAKLFLLCARRTRFALRLIAARRGFSASCLLPERLLVRVFGKLALKMKRAISDSIRCLEDAGEHPLACHAAMCSCQCVGPARSTIRSLATHLESEVSVEPHFNAAAACGGRSVQRLGTVAGPWLVYRLCRCGGHRLS